jgi:hypothetical protein
LLFSEYLHEKAEESRHNELIGYLIVTIGSVFFVGGLLETIITTMIAKENLQWFLVFPYHFTPNPDSLLGTSMTSVGVVLILLGVVLAIHYARERSWYMKELHRAHSVEVQKVKTERQNKNIRKLTQTKEDGQV